MDAWLATSKLLRKRFDLIFQYTVSGFPAGVEFTNGYFVRPHRTTTSGIALLCHITAHSAESTPHDGNAAGV